MKEEITGAKTAAVSNTTGKTYVDPIVQQQNLGGAKKSAPIKMTPALQKELAAKSTSAPVFMREATKVSAKPGVSKVVLNGKTQAQKNMENPLTLLEAKKKLRNEFTKK